MLSSPAVAGAAKHLSDVARLCSGRLAFQAGAFAIGLGAAPAPAYHRQACPSGRRVSRAFFAVHLHEKARKSVASNFGGFVDGAGDTREIARQAY
jgi:hypothetical protein